MKSILRAALCARAIARHGGDILASPGMGVERSIPQHGITSVYGHSLNVAFTALITARRLRLRVDERALVRGALLHDFFLYDWHERGHGMLHGVTHPQAALANAKKAFPLSEVEADVIARHMFPLDPRPPRHRESWLVSLADKRCAVCETFHLPVMSEVLLKAIEDRAGEKGRG